MPHKLLTTLTILALVLSPLTVFAAKQQNNAVNTVSTYRLGPGDKIVIQVYGEPDMGLEAKLTDAGTFFHPLLGEIKAVDLTIGDLSSLLTKEIKDRYLVDPKVSVNILEYREYFINGEVQKPGAYHYEPGLTVYKAISVAGGFTQRASRTAITLITDKDPTHTPQEAELNTPVHPGDIITIDESFF